MKASQYKLQNCILDHKSTTHVILIDEINGLFVPLFVSYEQCVSAIYSFENEKLEEQKTLWDFVLNSWTQMGFELKSIILDYKGGDGVLVPTLTLVQEPVDGKKVYLTIFIPIGTLILASIYLDIPIYLTRKQKKW